MKERVDNRVLGAIRWIDANSRAPISLPLVATSESLRFVRNLSGLSVVLQADGLEKHMETFDLNDLAEEDEVDVGTIDLEGQVIDPTATYMPTKFTLSLPRNPSPELIEPDKHRPANSLFVPMEVELLPSPSARVPAGWAQIRLLIADAGGKAIPNALARVVSVDDDTILGCGLSDSRGETLVAVAGLKNFAPGATEDEVVTVETEARLEVIIPAEADETVNWKTLRDATVAAGDTLPDPLKLKPGGIYSHRYPFTT